jgi:hypothetical protein
MFVQSLAGLVCFGANSFRAGDVVRARLLIAVLLLSASASYASARDDAPVPAAQILAERLCHGMGTCPLEASVLRDPKAAEALVSCRHWIESATLQRSGDSVGVKTSLRKLDAADLLEHDGTRIRSRYPILMGRDREDYFDLIRPAAKKMETAFRPRLKKLLATIARSGWAEWSYHFAWSGVFDSQFIWADLFASGVVPPLSPEIVWVVYPQHPNKSGTNYYPNDQITATFLMVTWVPGPGDHPATISTVGRNWRQIYETGLSGKKPAAEDAAVLERLGLLDANGRSRVPVVRAQDSLYRELRVAARDYLAIVHRDLPVREISKRFDIDERIAFAMAYHDASWEVLQLALDHGLLRRPASLTSDGDNRAAGAESLIDAYPPFIKLVRVALDTRSR